MSKRKRNGKKKIVKLIIIIMVIFVLGIGVYFIIDKDVFYEEEKLDTSMYYNELVKTNKESDIYIKENDEYKKIGLVGNDVELSLNEIVDVQNPYFNIKEFDGEYYINYKDVDKITELSKQDDRYKVYIVFNNNAKTEEITNFYDEEGNLVYSINQGYSLPIIIKEDNMYGVEFNNRLLYIKNEECEIIDNHNTDQTNSSGVGVLNYHFFFDDNDPEESRGCREEICVSKTQFISELDFLDDNNIITIKSRELENYIDGKIQ